MGVQLNFLHQIVGIVHSLRQRNVKHGTRGPAEPPAGKLGIAHDADDAESAGILGDIEAKVLIQRFFRALEKALHEGFVDDGHGRSGFIVRRTERAPAQNWHAKILKIVGAYAVPRGTRLLVELPACRSHGTSARFATCVAASTPTATRTGVRMSCLSLWFVAASLPAMSKEAKLLNVSYDPTRELYAAINDLFAERYKSRTGVSVIFEQSHVGDPDLGA